MNRVGICEHAEPLESAAGDVEAMGNRKLNFRIAGLTGDLALVRSLTYF